MSIEEEGCSLKEEILLLGFCVSSKRESTYLYIENMSKRALLGKRLFSNEGFKGLGYGLSRIGNREREHLYIEILAKECLAQERTAFI